MIARMELRSLAYFVRVAELGSITRAASHLHLAQPALTRHVQRLEEELGVALFTRANRGVRLEEFLIDGRVDIALLSELSRSRLILSTGLGCEEMVLVTRPGARASGSVTGAELSRTPLVLGDGLRAAMDALLAGRGIELKVETEVNDHETMRLMVQRGAAASVLPYSSVARECERGLHEAQHLTEGGVFRNL